MGMRHPPGRNGVSAEKEPLKQIKTLEAANRNKAISIVKIYLFI
jgi:hypothetical protein